MNASRIATTNAFRRQASYEIVIGEALRLEDNKYVSRQIISSIKAHGLDHTLLLANKIDQHFHTSAEESSNLTEGGQRPPFKDIKQRADELSSLDNVDDNDIESYEAYLLGCAESAAKRVKAVQLEDRMKAVYGDGLQILTVTAQGWLDWLNRNRSTDPNFGPNMTGIPRVQQALLHLAAEQNLPAYRNHYFHALPKIVKRCYRILKKNAQEGGYEHFQASAKKAIESFKVASSKSMVVWAAATVPKIFTGLQREEAASRVRLLIQLWKIRWDVRWNTWNMTLGENGIPCHSDSVAYSSRDVNWNRDLLETMETPTSIQHSYTSSIPFVGNWREKMLADLDQCFVSSTQAIVTVCKKIRLSIDTLSVSADLKNRTITTWESSRCSISRVLDDYKTTLQASITEVYRAVTTEEDVECLISQLNKPRFREAYDQQKGEGAWGRQQEKLLDVFKNFVAKYEEAAIAKMKARLIETANEMLKSVAQELYAFVKITEVFFKSDTYNTPQHVQARQKLTAWLPKYRKTLNEIQRAFPAQMPVEKGKAKVKAKVAPHPAKRIKIEHETGIAVKKE
ncbi:hypothetical protein CC80DRAFT_172248 [Byssothecium circinans]|uniref:Uncharacterized protein n=1 Tax=Byssothecium circinans TaxID=147558 RepID=A0A6A5TKF0_9PLEO|nr:hypothetical protein CC80DRAFT_172248 [Byssothecium circinans]